MRILSLRAALSLVALVAAAALAVVAMPALPARAGEPEDAAKTTAKLDALQRVAMKAFAEKRYEDAAAACREMVALAPESETQRYNLGCALARLGKTKEAVEALRGAYDKGFFDADVLEEDEDLACLREDAGFKELLVAARTRSTRADEMAYEGPGDEMPGMRVVEGHPPNGLRWRLRIGKEATAAKPHRLVVWLHPSGASLNEKVEPLAKEFAARGFALLVVTAKDWNGWTERQTRRLLEGTLPDVAKSAGESGLDARRPILMGFSAGAQLALILWAKDPTRWGGIVVDAGYPVDVEKSSPGHVVSMPLPAGDAKKATPFFVVVGGEDEGRGVWTLALPSWRTAGVPITYVEVADRGHEWLLEGAPLASLWTWLAGVPAAK